MGQSQNAKRARKLIASGRAKLLEGRGITVNSPPSAEVRKRDGISPEAVASLKVRFGFRWLTAPEVGELAVELLRRLTPEEVNGVFAAIDAAYDPGAAGEKGGSAA